MASASLRQMVVLEANHSDGLGAGSCRAAVRFVTM